MENNSLNQTEELVYSKKQINPLIEKFHIKPETNSKFKQIILMFKDQTNFQIWGIKVIFNRYTTIDVLESIKKWSDENHQLVSKLSKKNIVSYTGAEGIRTLMTEMDALSKLALVKRNVNKFNTDQRKILSDYIGDVSNGISCATNTILNKLFDKFQKFEKFSDWKQNNFLTKCSALRNADLIIDALEKCLSNSWEWDKQDLLEFVKVNTPTTDIVYDNDNVVLLNIKDYESSCKTCGGSKTQWCITNQPSQFENYITSKNRKQFFMFNFNLQETNDLSKIGFTVDAKEGITAAHSTRNDCLLPGKGYSIDGKKTDILTIISEYKVPFSVFMDIQKSSLKYDWNAQALLEYAEKNNFNVKYNKGNIIIIEVNTEYEYNSLMSHTYVSANNFKFDSNDCKAYLIYNFNVNYDFESSISSCQVRTDDYGTESVYKIYNIFGREIDKNEYYKAIGVKESDFLTDISLLPEIKLQKYIDEGRFDEAIELIKENPDININYSFNSNTAFSRCITAGSFDVFKEIINHDDFDGVNVNEDEDAPIIQLTYAYVFSSGESSKLYKDMLQLLIESKKYDSNSVSTNGEVLLSTCLMDEKADWFSEILIKDMHTDINFLSSTGESILSNALAFGTKNMVELITKRPDLIVRDIDKTLAKENGYNLDELIKPMPELFHNSDETSDKKVDNKAKKIELSDKDKETIAKIRKLFLS